MEFKAARVNIKTFTVTMKTLACCWRQRTESA